MTKPNSNALPDARLSGLRILAADDNPINRMVLQEMLEIEGADIVCVADGRQLIERVGGDSRWDLILTDLQMPEVDGHEAARRLRQIAPELPVVGITAHAGADDRARCIASGMVDYLAKPYKLDQLVEVVRRNARPAPE